MRLKISKSKNAASFYVIKTIYENGKESTITVEKLGTEEFLRENLDGLDPYVWAKAYVANLNKQEAENRRKIMTAHSPDKLVQKNQQLSSHGGYLFLQKIYYELKIDQICKSISDKYKFSFDLNEILSYLIYCRILFPSSKRATTELAKKFIEPPRFILQHVYRSLEVLSREADYIQAQLYKNSLNTCKRNTGVLFYDCTNFFFEIEQENGLKQYGKSKENRPNPIVQMGLFTDGDGLPLAFSIQKGNTNEQITLQPLEKKILSDFSLAKFVVCTDAGLASAANRKFNDIGERGFITTQSIKQLKEHLKKWALDTTGWYLFGEQSINPKTRKPLFFDISTISDEEAKGKTFFKERWINENGLEQRLLVTFSLKHKKYQQTIRSRQIERALKLMDTNPKKIGKVHQNDYKRFIQTNTCTPEGKKADKEFYNLDQERIQKEAMYDGFYGICTNLEDTATEIVKINHRRWEIEESFRIMKSEFKSRPVYLSRDDRIEAHFITCFLSLMVFRLLEKKLKEQYTSHEILSELKDMNFYEVKGEGYIPTYTRSDFTDSLHESYGFRTDYEIVSKKNMKEILKNTKS